MMKRGGAVVVAFVGGVLASGLSGPAWAVLNNGFETDWVYATSRAARSCPPIVGAIVAFDDTTLEFKQSFQVGAEWVTLTFAGTGSNDARLFVARGNALPNDPSSDIELAELDASGNIVGSIKLLSSLTGGPSFPVSALGVQVGNLRYSIFHGRLLLSVTPQSDGSTPFASEVHEIDLGLTTVFNTYTGPTCLATGNPNFDRPFITLNPNDGTIYVTGQNVNEATDTGLGDLVAIDTPGGPPGVMTTLIDGTTLADPNWTRPVCPIWRGNNNPEGNRPTIGVTIQNANGGGGIFGTVEYYLDANDGSFPPDGNLIKRGPRNTAQQMPWRGQLDEYSGTMMSVRRQGGTGSCPRGTQGGIDQVRPDDVDIRVDAPVSNNMYRRNAWLDVASPGFRISGVLPLETQERTMLVNQQSSVEFMMRNKGYTNSDPNVNFAVNYTVAKVPDDASTAWLSFSPPSGLVSPGNVDKVSANIDTTGLTAGTYMADVTFTDNATPPNVHTRTLVLHVIDCAYEVSPEKGIYVNDACPSSVAYQFTVRNTGTTEFNYTVAETNASGTPLDHPFLTIDKTSGGPIPIGGTDVVTATVAQGSGANVGYLTFWPAGCVAEPSPLIRSVDVRHYPQTPELVYQGDVDPTLPDSFGTGWNFFMMGGTVLQGSVVSDPDASDTQAWKIEDDAGLTTHFVSGGAGGEVIEHHVGSTMVARIKVESNLNLGGMFFFNRRTTANDPTSPDGLAVRLGWGGDGPSFPGRARNFFSSVTSDDSGLRAEYVILRMTAGTGTTGARTFNVYLNEDPTPILTETQTGENQAIVAGGTWGWGSDGPSGTGTYYIDWITATNAGMFAPGEEVACLGRSLVPSPCPDPFADADEDGDVDMIDFSFFQRCITQVAPAELPEECRCFDRAAPTGLVNIFDLAAFQACAKGPDVPADTSCDGGP